MKNNSQATDLMHRLNSSDSKLRQLCLVHTHTCLQCDYACIQSLSKSASIYCKALPIKFSPAKMVRTPYLAHPAFRVLKEGKYILTKLWAGPSCCRACKVQCPCWRVTCQLLKLCHAVHHQLQQSRRACADTTQLVEDTEAKPEHQGNQHNVTIPANAATKLDTTALLTYIDYLHLRVADAKEADAHNTQTPT